MKVLALLLCASLLAACERSATATTPANVTMEPRSLSDALVVSDTLLQPASGGQGDYLITSGGVWLLRGGEALRVREVDGFSQDVPWTPTTQPSQTLRIPISVNRD